jgi:hypothetical protein
MTDLDLLILELDLPGSDLAASALSHIQTIADPMIFAHSVRTFLYGRFLAERDGLVAGLDFDTELLFLGCVLHDAGLTERGNGDQPFNLDGADLAAEFLAEAGLAEEGLAVVWDAIALHLDPVVARRKRPEIAYVNAGAGFDLGAVPASFPQQDLARIHAWLPRRRVAVGIKDMIVKQALAKPQKAPPFTLPGELVRQETGRPWPTWEQLTQESDWSDHAETDA